MGHYASNCPEAKKSGANSNSVQFGMFFAQSGEAHASIDKNWILLDTCSTDSICNNKHMVKNVHKCKDEEELRLFTD